MAQERLDEHATGKLVGLLKAGDPKGEVAPAWHADRKPSGNCMRIAILRSRSKWVDQLSRDMQDRDCPPEVRQPGRTMRGATIGLASRHRGPGRFGTIAEDAMREV